MPKIADPDWLPFGESGIRTDLGRVTYNRWRSRLPGHCWTCPRFQRCSPGVHCSHNPDWKK